MDKYQWTCTGMSVQPVENGPMRYVREVDYDQLQTKIEELTAGIRDHIGWADTAVDCDDLKTLIGDMQEGE